MWFDGIRQPDTLYVANTSRGKDSTAMLRAIQIMGWPLDMICSVDIWFDEDTPAELPPMVRFKDEYDQKVLEWFGVPVTRLCATKPVSSQTIQVERERERERESQSLTESATHESKRIATCFTDDDTAKGTDGTSTDSPKIALVGAKASKKQTISDLEKLTYCDIFYRKVSPKRERERVAARQELERKLPNLRIPDAKRQLVSVPQTIGTLGFPSQKCRWCTGELKKAARFTASHISGGVVPQIQEGLHTDSRADSGRGARHISRGELWTNPLRNP